MDIEVKMPDIGADAVEIIEILVKIGDTVQKDESLVTVEGQKISMEIPSTSSGIVKSVLVKVGQQVNTGSLIVLLESLENDELDLSQYGSSDKVEFVKEKLIHATPIIRRLARKLNINLSKVTGSGRKGRIIKEDIMPYLQKKHVKEENDSINDLSTDDSILSDSNKSKDINELYLTNVQQVSGQHLFQSWSTVPHVTQFDESDITELDKFRREYNSKLNTQNVHLKLTILVFAIKVVAKSLKVFPKFNSILCTDTKKKLILNKYINIGIAVDTKQGLLVPVINNVNKKKIVDLSIELRSLSNKAKLGTLNISNMTGGSFTISNLGGIGGTGFTPIINYPEVAILGMSKAMIKPCWNGKEFIPRLVLPLSLSYDHRVIDGVEAVRFISFISKLLSDIRLLMI
ncbi:2-oxo acid dehydrogenase subunit E2 [Buchnera aphidicola]|uniref:Dihydrolipoamide acetyltransferase component of pyruvate dehydrogenase complex n=1 Tax=Buchnera aphidicola subsp. Melaphis rhois TaxID=118103 RepID=A0A4D6YFV5_BUCMH|nr:2-oxo acid dehydrogenase subunit E2 [Buchnera aphidicola]QCI23225.1 biotin/lipoyl-binding protein [Buchnera aphidicola (Melaphis rhois)]